MVIFGKDALRESYFEQPNSREEETNVKHDDFNFDCRVGWMNNLIRKSKNKHARKSMDGFIRFVHDRQSLHSTLKGG